MIIIWGTDNYISFENAYRKANRYDLLGIPKKVFLLPIYFLKVKKDPAIFNT